MHPLTLRTKFVLVLLFGAIVPLGVVGYWLARSAERSGEELLRERLEDALSVVGEEIGSRWLVHRSRLLDIASAPQVERRLLPGDGSSAGRSTLIRDELGAPVLSDRDPYAAITIFGPEGEARLEITRDSTEGGSAGPPLVPALPVEAGIHAPRTGERIGTIATRIPWSDLLSGGVGSASVAGSLLAVFDGRTEAPVLVPSIEPDLVRQGRFELGGESWISVSRSLMEPPLEIVLSAPLAPFEQPFAQAARRGTLALLAVAGSSLLLVTLLSGRITRSLGRLAGAADAVASGDLDRKVPEDGGDELARVATSFNAMTERLQGTLRELSQRRSLAAVGEFAASLAHEVRNPLSSIRLDLQRAREKIAGGDGEELVERALRSVERLDRTVTGALTIARGGNVDCRPLDLHAVVAAAIRAAEPEFEKREVVLDLEFDPTGAFPALGDPAALEQVFLNLLLNAAQASAPGSRTRVSVVRGPTEARVTVSDGGHGIPDADRERVFDAFYSTRKEGTGLGLATARQIVSAHGGEIEIGDREGGGTAVVVQLPLAPQMSSRP